jgi:hypothetical protein
MAFVVYTASISVKNEDDPVLFRFVHVFPLFTEYFNVVASDGIFVIYTLPTISEGKGIAGGNVTTKPKGPVRSITITEEFDIVALVFPAESVHKT